MASIAQPAKQSEEALARYLPAACGVSLNDISIVKRFDDDELPVNRLSIICRKAARELPEAEPTGCFVCEVSAKLTTHFAEKSGRDHDEAAGAVFDAMMRDSASICADLNAAMKGESFTALFFWPPDAIEFSTQGKNQISEMVCRLHMLPLASE